MEGERWEDCKISKTLERVDSSSCNKNKFIFLIDIPKKKEETRTSNIPLNAFSALAAFPEEAMDDDFLISFERRQKKERKGLPREF
jgi:hypothetical protein